MAANGDKLSVEYLSRIGVAEWSSESAAASSSTEACGSSKAAKGSPKAAPKSVASPKAQPKSAPKAAAAPAGPPPEEKTKEELAKMTKEERTAYYAARRAGGEQAAAPKAVQMSKADRRAMQEAQRKVKDDKKMEGADAAEMLEELKLQGLTEEQAKEVLAHIENGEVEEEEESDDEPLSLLASVKEWMDEQGTKVADKESLRDFNLKVRFQGHVETTPPDHLACMLRIITTGALESGDLKAPKLQPTVVAKKAGPTLERWSFMIDGLYSKIDDVLESVDVVIGSLREGIDSVEAPETAKDTALVGCLMALRDSTDDIEDEDLLTGCKRLDPMTKVMEKFIEFLEDELEDSDEDGSGED